MKITITLILLFSFFYTFSKDDKKKIQITPDISLIRISDNAYIHTTYFELPEFGRFPSNGLIFIDNDKAFLFDTPMTNELTKTLVSWVQDSMNIKIVGFVPNHWHNDCIGGLTYLKSLGIESYANKTTIEIAESKNLPVPGNGFKDSLILKLNNKEIVCSFFGPGHSSDNIVVWIPSEEILFGGCMVKEYKAKTLGNIADADLEQWPGTIDAVLERYGNAKIVIPGHGEPGGVELLEHTKKLLSGR